MGAEPGLMWKGTQLADGKPVWYWTPREWKCRPFSLVLKAWPVFFSLSHSPHFLPTPSFSHSAFPVELGHVNCKATAGTEGIELMIGRWEKCGWPQPIRASRYLRVTIGFLGGVAVLFEYGRKDRAWRARSKGGGGIKREVQ